MEEKLSDLARGFLFYQSDKKLPLIKKAKGIRIWDESGKEYIDACSGAIICNIGHGNERVEKAIREQAQKAFFAYRTQFENEPAVLLAEQLVKHSAPHLNKVFFVSGGSEAVESAIKLSRQYFYSKGQGSRYLFVSRTPSYHGSTLGALALTSYAPLEIPFGPMIQSYPKIPAPYCYRCIYGKAYPRCNIECARALETTILEHGQDNVAAFVVEPIVGASIGALVPPENYFSVVQDTCRKYGIHLILDEVMTGFGRTGKLFAYEHWGVEADIVALSKGMASGYYPLGAVMASEHIVDQVLRAGGFAHGHTYAGNPMACAVGLEVFKIIIEEHLSENSAAMGQILKAGLEELAKKYAIIGEVRGKGLLTAIELVKDPDTREPFPAEKNINMLLTDVAAQNGLIIYPRKPINGLSGDHVLIAPPLIINEQEVYEIVGRLDSALKSTVKKI